MERLVGNIENYAWGSHTALASLRGEGATAEPEAELWLGAHPKAPSRLAPCGRGLDEVIAGDPEGTLGDAVAKRFGGRLPYLLKLLAAAKPLSIQAHPNLEQAREGFAREEAAGIDRSAPDRTFRDDNHKPELIVAITPFEAMVGFRATDHTAAFLDHLAVSALAPVRELIGAGELVETLRKVLEMDDETAATTVAAMARAVVDRPGGDWSAECDLIARLAEDNPRDPGVVTAALLNRVLLEPGEGLYLDAGHLHAYVGGFGVELMASSDNVLRGGLTPKHIDVPNLLDIVVGQALEPEVLSAEGHLGRYQTPAPEFRLDRIGQGGASDRPADGPEIVVAVGGPAELICPDGSLTVAPGEAAWLAHGHAASIRADGDVFVAGVGDGS